MIQRIQSIYLFLATVAVILILFAPVAKFVFSDTIWTFNTHGIFDDANQKIAEPLIPFVFIIPFVALVLFLNIFFFKTRRRQLLIGKVAYLLLMALVILIFLSIDRAVDAEVKPKPFELAYGWGAFMPIFALVFVFLANRAIRKDDELIRSMDRIR